MHELQRVAKAAVNGQPRRVSQNRRETLFFGESE